MENIKNSEAESGFNDLIHVDDDIVRFEYYGRNNENESENYTKKKGFAG